MLVSRKEWFVSEEKNRLKKRTACFKKRTAQEEELLVSRTARFLFLFCCSTRCSSSLFNKVLFNKEPRCQLCRCQLLVVSSVVGSSAVVNSVVGSSVKKKCEEMVPFAACFKNRSKGCRRIQRNGAVRCLFQKKNRSKKWCCSLLVSITAQMVRF